jgi:hypothetical protein
MSYIVKSHDDSIKSFIIEYKSQDITVNYPGDVQTFSELSEEDISLLVSGIVINITEIETNSTPVPFYGVMIE